MIKRLQTEVQVVYKALPEQGKKVRRARREATMWRKSSISRSGCNSKSVTQKSDTHKQTWSERFEKFCQKATSKKPRE